MYIWQRWIKSKVYLWTDKEMQIVCFSNNLCFFFCLYDENKNMIWILLTFPNFQICCNLNQISHFQIVIWRVSVKMSCLVSKISSQFIDVNCNVTNLMNIAEIYLRQRICKVASYFGLSCPCILKKINILLSNYYGLSILDDYSYAHIEDFKT